jgi:hypothetical protein
MEAAPIIYRIDAQDFLCSVSDSWSEFARANFGQDVLPDKVIGVHLWDFIADGTSRELYRRLVARARRGDVVRFSYRCDAPAERRNFTLTISPAPDGGVEFRSEMTGREARPPVFWLSPDAQRSKTFLTLCSWCARVRMPDGSWAEIERAMEQHPLFKGPLAPRLTHGICEHCLAKMRQVVESEGPGR